MRAFPVLLIFAVSLASTAAFAQTPAAAPHIKCIPRVIRPGEPNPCPATPPVTPTTTTTTTTPASTGAQICETRREAALEVCRRQDLNSPPRYRACTMAAQTSYNACRRSHG